MAVPVLAVEIGPKPAVERVWTGDYRVLEEKPSQQALHAGREVPFCPSFDLLFGALISAVSHQCIGIKHMHNIFVVAKHG